MKTLKGTTISVGNVCGKAFLVRRYSFAGSDGECSGKPGLHISDLDHAFARSRHELESLNSLATNLGNAESAIFEAQLSIMEDSSFKGAIYDAVRAGLPPQRAILDISNEVAARFLSSKSRIIKSRVADIEDISRRLQRALCDLPPAIMAATTFPECAILLIDELFPSEAIWLENSNVCGIISRHNSPDSHAAMLVRAMGLPFISGIEIQDIPLRQDVELIAEAEEGIVNCLSSEEIPGKKSVNAAGVHAHPAALARTSDGKVHVELRANISRLGDLQRMHRVGMTSAGLVRTELLFLNHQDAPGVDEQIGVYSEITQQCGQGTATLRTFDFAPDKTPPFCSETPFESLLETQLQALANVHETSTNLAILVPKIESARQFRSILSKIHAFSSPGSPPEVGAMVENRAGLLDIDSILEIADFISIGTNDLAEDLLGIPRHQLSSMGPVVFHPKVFKAVCQITEKSRKTGKRLSVCGEVAGNPSNAALLVGAGVRILSMDPSLAHAVQSRLALHSLKELETMAANFIASTNYI